MAIELKKGLTYYLSGDWPATPVTVITPPGPSCSEALVRAPSGPVYAEPSHFYTTRLEADEATLVILRAQHANCKERLDLLQSEINEIETKKGQA